MNDLCLIALHNDALITYRNLVFTDLMIKMKNYLIFLRKFTERVSNFFVRRF